MKRFIFLLLLAVSQQSLAGNCEKLLCVSTGAGRTGVEECKNNSLRELYQDIWNKYNEDYCYETNAILNGGEWPCSLSNGNGAVAQVNVYTACIVVYGVKIRVANVVNVNAIPGAIVVGGNGTPLGAGSTSVERSSSSGKDGEGNNKEVKDKDGHKHTVTGRMTCANGQCSEPSYTVD